MLPRINFHKLNNIKTLGFKAGLIVQLKIPNFRPYMLQLPELKRWKINRQAVAAVVFICACFTTFFCAAQSLVYENYTVNDGLCGQTVYGALQDSKGFMWFATDAGISRFDGANFQNFTRNDGLADNEVLSMYEDSKGRLWLLSFNGQLCYLKDNVFHNPKNDSLMRKVSGSTVFFSFHEDYAGNIWFSTFDGTVIRINPADSISRYEIPISNSNESFFSFYETTDHELWIIGNKNFYKFEKEAFVTLSGPELKPADGLPYFMISMGNALFLSVNGLERLIGKNYGVVIPIEKIPFADKALRLHYTSRNDIWMTNKKDQTLYFKYSNGTYLPCREYLKGSAITFVYTDREENTWFCSSGNGIFKLPAQSFSSRSFTSADGLSQNNITAVNVSNDTTLWLGFTNGIVNSIKQNKIETFDCNFSGKNYNRIIQIVSDSDNNIWAATDYGVALIKRIYPKKYAPPFLVKINKKEFDYSCKALNYDTAHHLFVSWTSGIGEIRYSDNGYKIYPLKQNFKRIYTHFFDRNNKLWIATDEGLCSIENDSILSFVKSDERLKDRITSFCEISGDMLAFGTYGNGILFFKNKIISRQANAENGLSGEICKKLIADGDTIYAATDKGLSIIRTGNNSAFNTENYTTSDGLLSNGVNDVQIKFNTLYVATSEGLSILPLSLNRIYTEPPPLYITSMKVNTTLMDSLRNIKLSYDRQHLQFSFIAPTFDHPELLTYQYKLSGLNEDWVETKNNAVEFTALNPGVYVFQVRAKKYNSDWSKAELLKFEITAPFWDTIWFRLAIANLLILVFYFLLRDFVSKKYRRKLAISEQQRALQVERNRISTDMHDDLGAELTNIVILSNIARKTLKLENDQNRIIDKIGIAANDVINKMNEIIWAMNPSNDTLGNLVSYLHRYSKEYMELSNAMVQINIPASVPPVTLKAAFRRNVFLILKESLHNITKHSKAKNININIDIDKAQKKFRMSIQDDGEGFVVAERTGSGNGLINMKKRMAEINGNIHLISSEGKGAIVNVTVPY